MRRITILLLFLITVAASAQNDLRKGYIITNANDTVYGDIEYASDKSNSSICKFTPRGSFESKKFTPGDIKAYHFIESGKRYISRETMQTDGNVKVFLEYLVNGKLNLYYYRDPKSKDHYFVERDTLPLIELPPLVKDFYNNGSLYWVQNHKSISILELYTNDCPQLRKRIQKITLEHKPLVKLAEDYHNSVCKDQTCLVYKKKPYPSVYFIEPFLGTINYFHLNHYSFTGGVNLYNWIPRTDERLYFKTGFQYSKLDVDSASARYLKIPLMVEYQYPTGKLKPTAAIGQNLWFSNSTGETFMIFTTPVEVGLMYSVSEKVKMTLNYNVEFCPISFIFIPDAKFTILTQYISAGIRIKL